MAEGSTGKGRKSLTGYNCWGLVPLDNCVTASAENLIVNWGPMSIQTKSAKKTPTSPDGEGDPGEKIFLGVIHLDSFLIHEMSTDTQREFYSKHVHTIQLPSSVQKFSRCVILRAKWLTIKNGAVKLLLLCTNLATYFYNETGTKQLLKWDSDTTEGGASSNTPGEPADLSKCSKTIAATNDFVLLGNDTGEVHLFSYDNPRSGKGSSSPIQLVKTLKIASEPIAEMCGKRSGLVVVGTPSGSISVWIGFQGDASQPSKLTEYVLSKPEPVTGLVLWHPYLIASYGSGIIRMYNLVQKVLSAQVYAHARWISSMDLCSGQNLLLTIAEDDEARIWALRKRQKGEQRSPVSKG